MRAGLVTCTAAAAAADAAPTTAATMTTATTARAASTLGAHCRRLRRSTCSRTPSKAQMHGLIHASRLRSPSTAGVCCRLGESPREREFENLAVTEFRNTWTGGMQWVRASLPRERAAHGLQPHDGMGRPRAARCRGWALQGRTRRPRTPHTRQPQTGALVASPHTHRTHRAAHSGGPAPRGRTCQN